VNSRTKLQLRFYSTWLYSLMAYISIIKSLRGFHNYSHLWHCKFPAYKLFYDLVLVYNPVGGVVQWLGRRSMAGGLSLIYA